MNSDVGEDFNQQEAQAVEQLGTDSSVMNVTSGGVTDKPSPIVKDLSEEEVEELVAAVKPLSLFLVEEEECRERFDSFLGEEEVKLGLQTAESLLDKDGGFLVLVNIDKFEESSHLEIIDQLIEKGEGEGVVASLSRLRGVNHQEIAAKLIERGEGYLIGLNVSEFEGLNHREVVNQLIDSGDMESVVYTLCFFEGLDASIFHKLIKIRGLHYAAANLDLFEGLDASAAEKLIEGKLGGTVALKLDKFEGLKELIDICLENNPPWQIEDIKDNLEYVFLGEHIWEKLSNSECGPESYRDIKNKYHFISPKEVFRNIKENLALEEEFVYNYLTTQVLEGQDLESFEEGRGVFGTKRMMEYLTYNENSNLHQKLMYFPKIIQLQEISSLEPKHFYSNILGQVHKDGSLYSDGDSISHFNSLVSSFDIGIFTKEGTRKLVEKLNKYKEIFDTEDSFVSILSEDLLAIFESWNDFKRACTVMEGLKRGELLSLMKKIRKENKAKHMEWIKTVGFHKDSQVDLVALMEMLQEPERFLSRRDAHTPNVITEKKNPNNYTEFMPASEVIDSLIEGDLDEIQLIKPMRKEFILYKGGRSVEDIIRQALGSRREGIPGKALNPGVLFSELGNVFRGKGGDLVKFIRSGVSLEKYFSSLGVPYDEIKEGIEGSLFNEEYGLSDRFKKENRYRVIAEIHKKSDPMAVLAGDDTACCMPFGSGKNNIYMFNPTMSIFTLRLETGEDRFRTIAQSVLTANKDIGTPIGRGENLLGEENLENTKIRDKILQESPFVLGCDNVELASNYKNMSKEIGDLYTKFFTEYLQSDGNKNFDPTKVVIGRGYSDKLIGEKVPNTFIPSTIPGYSDNVGESSNILLIPNKELEGKNLSGVYELSPKDFLQVLAIEKEAYKDTSMREDFAVIMNNMIGISYYNIRYDRPNMCIKYVSNNKAQGYLIAYERDSDNSDEKELYIHDIAINTADSAFSYSGGKLITTFLEKYFEEYLKKGELMVVSMDARDKTSFGIIKRKLEEFENRLGIKLRVEEGESFLMGSEQMHPVRIVPDPGSV
jgi:hypothetical protein